MLKYLQLKSLYICMTILFKNKRMYIVKTLFAKTSQKQKLFYHGHI